MLNSRDEPMMAFSFHTQSQCYHIHPFLNPPLQHQTYFTFSFKTLNFKPCYSNTNIKEKKRKPKPSFYDQIQDKWSQNPLSQRTHKLPWHKQQHIQEEKEDEEIVSSELERPLEMMSVVESSDLECVPQVFDELTEWRKLDKPIVCFEGDADQTLSNSGLDNGFVSSSFTHGGKSKFAHFSHETKSDKNIDESDHIDLIGSGDLVKNLDFVEEVETGTSVEQMKAEKSTLLDRKFDAQSVASLSGKLDHVEVDEGEEIFNPKRLVNSLPWMMQNNEEKQKRSNTELAEKTMPEHELKRLRNLSLKMKERIKVGAAGVTQALVDKLHEKWKVDEVVKLKFEGPPSFNMKRIHEVLEGKTGGLVIWRSGTSVVLYRGLTYKFNCIQTYVGEKGLNLDTSQGSKKSLSESVKVPKDLSKGELMEVSKLNSMLEGLGPRYEDWSGCLPQPIDADLLPGVIPGYKTPFRSLPHGVKRCLKDEEMTRYRRLARNMPPHFALGRNRELQGLAAAMVKLWQKSAIAKIAIKRGVLNTNSDRMAEQLKRLTGGTLLSRNKEYIVFYRGNDFLSPSVSDALKERERLITLQHQEEEARLNASQLVNPKYKSQKTPMVAGTLAETVAATSRWGKQPSREDVEKMLKDSSMARHASLVRYLEHKLAMAKGKLKKADKALAKVQETLVPAELPTDLETITDEERVVFRNIGLSMKPYLLLGRREVFDGTIENMHMHWKFREVVKIIVKEKNPAQVKHIAVSLEAESGGVLVSIDKTIKGYAIILYRGKNYQRPLKLKPRNLLTKRQALARSIELQRREGLKHHISSLEEQLELLKSGLEEIDVKTFYEILDDPSIPSDDETEDEGEGTFVSTYDSGHEI